MDFHPHSIIHYLWVTLLEHIISVSHAKKTQATFSTWSRNQNFRIGVSYARTIQHGNGVLMRNPITSTNNFPDETNFFQSSVQSKTNFGKSFFKKKLFIYCKQSQLTLYINQSALGLSTLMQMRVLVSLQLQFYGRTGLWITLLQVMSQRRYSAMTL